ncbi:MAG: 4Fe-4S binding protein [Deltaproteobacteria bacterium]|nr:4Fe-4S binding protein [Deltaproteobacteria bacterium]MBW2043447.1 4Fe-4S binding protein [Deltaproteobacteria bacterium]MBW2299433.1 4Fe-4S binding protein [Deltaproteobacteria bacterium]
MSAKESIAPPMAAAKMPASPNKTGAWRFERPILEDRLAPCSEACPLGENIPAIMSLNSRGAFKEAYGEIRKENPFPGICGKICFHPCERVCNRGRFDEPVSIQELEFLVTVLSRDGVSGIEERHGPSLQRVAVIGGDIAGLSCAYFLRLLGYTVTILEPGARLRVFDLPTKGSDLNTKYLESDVKSVLDIGIDLRIRTTPEAIYYHQLVKEFQAVYVSPGAVDSEAREFLKGPDVYSVYNAIEVERMIRDGNPLPLRGKVAVTGSAREALKTAMSVKAIGGEPVVLVPFFPDDLEHMAEDLEDAERKGVSLKFGSAPFALSERDGRISGLACFKAGKGRFLEAKRRGPESEQTGSFEQRAEAVIIASPEKTGVNLMPPILQETGLVVVFPDRFPRARSRKLGKEKDLSRAVVRHMSEGKQAALSLDLCLRKRPFEEIYSVAVGRLGALSFEAYKMNHPHRYQRPLGNVVRAADLNPAYFKKAPRIKPSSPENGLTRRQGVLSARRCFQCGRCNSCQTCYQYCPDLAISVEPETGRPEIDYDHCKGCGICFKECPRGAISLQRE